MRQTILVVENDLDLRAAILEVLDAAGFNVVLAANAQEALDAQHSAFPALAVL